MITLFNRKELLLTNDMKKQNEIRLLLQANGIDYRVKTVSRNNPSPFAAGPRARMGSFGENLAAAYEYKIYVNKADYERAAALMHT